MVSKEAEYIKTMQETQQFSSRLLDTIVPLKPLLRITSYVEQRQTGLNSSELVYSAPLVGTLSELLVPHPFVGLKYHPYSSPNPNSSSIIITFDAYETPFFIENSRCLSRNDFAFPFTAPSHIRNEYRSMINKFYETVKESFSHTQCSPAIFIKTHP
jgi:hypothetical protein